MFFCASVQPGLDHSPCRRRVAANTSAERGRPTAAPAAPSRRRRRRRGRARRERRRAAAAAEPGVRRRQCEWLGLSLAAYSCNILYAVAPAAGRPAHHKPLESCCQLDLQVCCACHNWHTTSDGSLPGTQVGQGLGLPDRLSLGKLGRPAVSQLAQQSGLLRATTSRLGHLLHPAVVRRQHPPGAAPLVRQPLPLPLLSPAR